MQIQGGSHLAYQLQVMTAQLSLNQQEQQGQAVMKLLESSAAIATTGNSGSVVNTYA